MAVLRVEDGEVAATQGQERGRGRRCGIFLDVLLGDIWLGHHKRLLVRVAAIFEALVDHLDVAVDLMGFPHLVGGRSCLVALDDRDEVLALELIFPVRRVHVEGAEVGEGLREKRVERFVGGGSGELVEDHEKGLGPGLGLGPVYLAFSGEAFDVIEREFDGLVGAEDREQERDAFLRGLQTDDLAFGAGKDATDHAGFGADL